MSLNQTLELKTTGNLAGKMVFLDFISPSGNYHLVFKCKDVSSSEWEYLIKGCMIDNWRFSIIMNSVPTDDIKVWRITRTSTRLVIVCNGVIVVNFNFATDFKDGFDGCLDLWTSKSTAVAFPYVHGVYGPMVMRINSKYIIGHNYHGHNMHAGGISVNNYVRENKVREVYVRE